MAPSPPLASAGGAGAASSGRRGRRARPRRQGRRGVAQRTRTPNPARSRPRAVPGTSATVRRPPTITTLPASRAAGPAGVELCALWPAGSAGAPSLLARVVGRARTPQSAFPRGPAAVRSPGPAAGGGLRPHSRARGKPCPPKRRYIGPARAGMDGCAVRSPRSGGI